MAVDYTPSYIVGGVAAVAIIANALIAGSGRKNDFFIRHEDARLQLSVEYLQAVQDVLAGMQLGSKPLPHWYDPKRQLLARRFHVLLEESIAEAVDSVEEAIRGYHYAINVFQLPGDGLTADARLRPFNEADKALTDCRKQLERKLSDRFAANRPKSRLRRAAGWIRHPAVA